VSLPEAPGLSLAWASYHSLITDYYKRMPEGLVFGKLTMDVRIKTRIKTPQINNGCPNKHELKHLYLID
jgi:hypothetical protein